MQECRRAARVSRHTLRQPLEVARYGGDRNFLLLEWEQGGLEAWGGLEGETPVAELRSNGRTLPIAAD